MNEIETHPFEAFIPENASTLILGSFPGKEQTQGPKNDTEWFYGAKRNQFWKILSSVYNEPMLKEKNRNYKMELFKNAGIGIADIILKAKRINNTNSDINLRDIEFNFNNIESKLLNSKITSIYFTSKFVEKHFKNHFDNLFNSITIRECLPSPSPIFRRMNLEKKVEIYKEKLPRK